MQHNILAFIWVRVLTLIFPQHSAAIWGYGTIYLSLLVLSNKRWNGAMLFCYSLCSCFIKSHISDSYAKYNKSQAFGQHKLKIMCSMNLFQSFEYSVYGQIISCTSEPINSFHLFYLYIFEGRQLTEVCSWIVKLVIFMTIPFFALFITYHNITLHISIDFILAERLERTKIFL